MSFTVNTSTPTGRFAPSPSGRMHLGNIFTALISWLSVRKAGGKWILRIEDLDPQRSKLKFARQIEDDLHWLGLDWDEGGIDGLGDRGPYCQSLRNDIYQHFFDKLRSAGLTYKCHCTRADIMATQAPHESDGRIVYSGRCRPAAAPPFPQCASEQTGATRLFVPDRDIDFVDRVYGPQSVNLTTHCGDFVLQRADRAWAYQLAVVVDDALMGVSEVVRGNDLLLSSAQQIYIYELIGHTPPAYAHLPLVCNAAGQRLSKRDSSMSMAQLRLTLNPREIIGRIAHMAHIIDKYEPCSPSDLIDSFDWSKIPQSKTIEMH